MSSPKIKEPQEFLDGPIDGVIFCPLKTHRDGRGWLVELYRGDEMPRENLPAMAYVSETLPGVVRGPHHHVDQVDCFAFVGPGEFLVCLWDIRADSPTWGRTMRVVAGDSNKQSVTIPAGVVHAYKNIGETPGWTFNAANRLYAGPGKREPVDEVRHEDRPDCPYQIV